MTGPERVSPKEWQASALRDAFRHAELTVEELWMRFFGLGGTPT